MKMSQHQNKQWFTKNKSGHQIIEVGQLIFGSNTNTKFSLQWSKS